MLIPVFVYKQHAQQVHTTCSIHKNVRRGPEGLELRSEFDLCLFCIVSCCISQLRMFFVCFSYLYIIVLQLISCVFRMCFVLFRILQHDIRRKSPNRMCDHRFLLTNTFCIQHHGCMLLAQIIQKSKGSGFSSAVNLCLFRIVSYCFSYFC